MTAHTLVDGYNLLHKSQWLQRARGPGWLEKARSRLLVGIHDLLSESERQTTQIIFDASPSQTIEIAEQHFRGLRLTFAVGYEEADDLLEKLIRQHPQPRLLKVISSDHRIQRCARACRAKWIASENWLNELAKRRGLAGPPNPLDKSSILADDAILDSFAVEQWLTEFGVARSVKTSANRTEASREDSLPGHRVPSKPVKGAQAPQPHQSRPAPTRPPKLPVEKKTIDRAKARERAKQQLDQEIPPLDDLAAN